MRYPIPRVLISECADAFLAPIEGDFWEEHGISREETERGMGAALAHLGFLRREDLRNIEIEDRNEETIGRALDRAAAIRRRAALTPEQREMEDMLNGAMGATQEMLYQRIVDDFFAPPRRSM